MNMNSTDPFEALVNEHYQPLFRFAMSLTHTESDARDLTQHTFYTWAAKGHQLRDLSKVKTWLYTTLHRAFLQVRRRQTRFPHHELDEVSPHLPVLEPDFVKQSDCSQVLPALAKVDEVFRGAVALFYFEDCSYKEIAALLDVPVGTVKSRIARGLAQLREILENGNAPVPRKTSPLNGSPRTNNSSTDTYDEWDLSSTRVTEQFGAA